MNEIDKLNAQIETLESKIAELKQRKTALEAAENALSACFDGLKLIADKDNPFTLILPQRVYANMFYTYNGTLYVCVANGIATDDNFSDYMEAWEIQ